MKILFEPWRKYILREETMNELTLPFSSQAKVDNEMKRQAKELAKELEAPKHKRAWTKIKQEWAKVTQEYEETKEATALAWKKLIQRKKLTAAEEKDMLNQFKEIALGTSLAVLFAVPTGSVWASLLIKKFGDKLLPSAFRNPLSAEEAESIEEGGLPALPSYKNIPGRVLPDDDDEAQDREQIKQLKEKGAQKRIRLSFKAKVSGGCG